MAIDFKKFGKSLAEKADQVAKDVQEKMPDAVKNIDTAGIAAKADELAKKVQSELPDSMKNIDVKSKVQDMAVKGSQALAKFAQQEKETDKRVKEVLGEKTNHKLINYKDALRVLYYIMSVDHEITPDEKAKFDEVGKEIDQDYAEYRETLIDSCTLELVSASKDQDYYDIVHELVGNAINNTETDGEHGLDVGFLYWNVLAIAYSDGNCGEEEQRLIRYIGRLTNLDKSVMMELERSVKTLLDIETEEKYLKESGRSYSEVQKHIEDLSKRRSAILQGAFALLTD